MEKKTEKKTTEWSGENLIVIDPQYSVNKVDFLWKVIQRFDFYINSTNTKASAIIAFNTFVLGGIVFRAIDILPSTEIDHRYYLVSGYALIISAISSLVSLIATFFVISPFLKSSGDSSSNGNEPYSSMIFFCHIAKLDSAFQFNEKIQFSNDDEICKDLSIQAYSLAQGLNRKFETIKMIFFWIFLIQLPAFGITISIKLYTLIFL
jgi:hypothetical protein